MQNTKPLEALLKRDRTLVVSGLVAILALAWGYTIYVAYDMDMMGREMAMMPMMRLWSAGDFVLMYVMWAVMMVAMMVPSAAPMVLIFAAVHRKRREQGGAFVPTGVFLAGYLVVWSVFSLAAVLSQYGLQRAALLSPMMETTAPWLGAALLAAAGAFQFMPLKEACLAKCRTPMGFIMIEWRESSRGAFIMGLRHGTYCTGCCWALMALLFVGGVMNLLWVAFLAVFVLLEKVIPAGGLLGKTGGIIMIAWGAWMVWQSWV
ncbi:MAG: DUF2182 domain-containing protein [Proteobacteria bacterium]|nr:DUF2182 domain-containing protein [Pseudomonadota bacterium]